MKNGKEKKTEGSSFPVSSLSFFVTDFSTDFLIDCITDFTADFIVDFTMDFITDFTAIHQIPYLPQNEV